MSACFDRSEEMTNCTTELTGNQNTTTASVLLIPFSTATLILNIISLIVLLRSGKLRKSKFLSLLISLSINNVVVSFVSISIIVTTLVQMQCVHIGNVCLFLHLLTNTALSCSLLQVIFICIERLVATFSVSNHKRWSKVYIAVYSVSMLTTATFVVFVYSYFSDFESSSCRVVDIFAQNIRPYQFCMCIKRLIMIGTFIAVYSIVVVRLKTRMNQITPSVTSGNRASTNRITTIQVSSMSTSQSALPNLERNQSTSGRNDLMPKPGSNNLSQPEGNGPPTGLTSREKRFRQSMVTLVIVIIATCVCVLPSVIFNMLSSLTVGVVSDKTLEFINIFVVLNPLIDPIVYVLRIKDFRDQIRCWNRTPS